MKIDNLIMNSNHFDDEFHDTGMELCRRQCDDFGPSIMQGGVKLMKVCHRGDGYVIRGSFPALAGFQVALTKSCGGTSQPTPCPGGNW